MPFPLETFESFVDSKIKERGYRYYMNGAIATLKEVRAEEWKAEVQGTELYNVGITINEGVVDVIRCSCPYNFGPVCKHVVAVCYALREKFLNTEANTNLQESVKPDRSGKPKRKPSGRKTVAERIEERLDQLSPEQMRGFIQETLEDDRYLRSIFMSRFTPEEHSKTKSEYRKQVKQLLAPAKNSRHFVGWREAYKYLDGIRELLSNVEQQLGQGNTAPVIAACQVIIEELVPAFQYIDDSGGDVGYLVDQSFDLLSEAADRDLDEATRRQFFAACLEQSGDERYSEWDFDHQFVHLAIALAQKEDEFNQIEAQLTGQYEQSKNDSDFIASYNQERFAGQLLELYEASGQQEKRLQFMQENRHLSNVMEQLIHYAWQRQKYQEVRNYCEEALQQFKDKPGLDQTWFGWLWKVAEVEEDIDEQRNYAEKLLLHTGNMEWYKKMKSLYKDKSWPAQVDELLNALQTQKGGRYSYLLPSICIEEKRWDQLFDYVAGQPDLSTLQRYDSWLIEDYFDEIMEFYKSALLQLMEHNTGRKYYREVCDYLQRMEALGGSRKKNEVVRILQAHYANRPALLDELSKAGLAD